MFAAIRRKWVVARRYYTVERAVFEVIRALLCRGGIRVPVQAWMGGR